MHAAVYFLRLLFQFDSFKIQINLFAPLCWEEGVDYVCTSEVDEFSEVLCEILGRVFVQRVSRIVV